MRKVIVTVQTAPQPFSITTIPAGISITIGSFEPIEILTGTYT